ncbi:MAG: hypothetical protein L3J95_05260 [Thermoplasmata archaeon]|nr:hypothetical protein [Thermoplasmata archaeon]MCI4359809.1 hypothetical protein [Thermoplasmata archaeon]
MNLLALLETPELALPTILLAGSFVVWAAGNIRDPAVAIVRATLRPVPDRDPVSRAYHAFESGAFTDVLARAAARLDRSSAQRFGRPATRLPSTRWGARRLQPARATEVIALSRLARRIESMHDVAQRREAGVWLRLAFWRSRAELRARFHARLVPVLDEVARVSTPAGGPA